MTRQELRKLVGAAGINVLFAGLVGIGLEIYRRRHPVKPIPTDKSGQMSVAAEGFGMTVATRLTIADRVKTIDDIREICGRDSMILELAKMVYHSVIQQYLGLSIDGGILAPWIPFGLVMGFAILGIGRDSFGKKVGGGEFGQIGERGEGCERRGGHAARSGSFTRSHGGSTCVAERQNRNGAVRHVDTLPRETPRPSGHGERNAAARERLCPRGH
jgi:hypothetical protein